MMPSYHQQSVLCMTHCCFFEEVSTSEMSVCKVIGLVNEQGKGRDRRDKKKSM